MNTSSFIMKAIYLSIVTLLFAGCASAQVEPTETITPPPPTATADEDDKVSQMVQNISWLRSTNPYGHTGIKIQTDEQVFYLDPVDLVGIEALPKADLILVTHNHDDHFSPQTISELSNEDTAIVSIESILRSFSDNTYPIAPGEKINAAGLNIEGVPAYNDYHAKNMGFLGFIFSINDVRIYLSGDTDFVPEMEALTDIDIAVMNVREPYSLSGEEVVNFAKIVKPKVIIPIHWIPENDTYGDKEQIEYIQQYIPSTTQFIVLELTPQS